MLYFYMYKHINSVYANFVDNVNTFILFNKTKIIQNYTFISLMVSSYNILPGTEFTYAVSGKNKIWDPIYQLFLTPFFLGGNLPIHPFSTSMSKQRKSSSKDWVINKSNGPSLDGIKNAKCRRRGGAAPQT